MKNRIALMSVVVFVLGVVVSATASPVLMKRSCQTVKFEAQKAESVEFASRKGRFETVSRDKAARAEKKTAKRVNTLAAPKAAASGTDLAGGFSMASEFIAAQNAYKLVMTDTTGGVVISDEPLDQAPAEGYASSAECLLELADKAYEAKKYVYLKTKTGDKDAPLQYSRLELDMTVGRAKLIMDINAVTNPDGSANLRYDKKAQRQLIAQRRKKLDEAVKNKTATDEQVEEMNELMILEMQDRQAEHGRWDFDGNRRRIMQQKRQRQLEADGRVKPKKRTVKQDGEVAADTK